MKKARKPLSLLLALAMVLSLAAAMPMTGLAAPADPTTVGGVYDPVNTVKLTLGRSQNFTVAPKKGTPESPLGFEPADDGIYRFSVPKVQKANGTTTTYYDCTSITVKDVAEDSDVKLTGRKVDNTAARCYYFYYELEGGKKYTVEPEMETNTTDKVLTFSITVSFPQAPISSVALQAGETAYYNYKAPSTGTGLYTFTVLNTDANYTYPTMKVTVPGYNGNTTGETVANWSKAASGYPQGGRYYTAYSFYMKGGTVATIELANTSAAGVSTNVTVAACGTISTSNSFSNLNVGNQTDNYTVYRTWTPGATGLYSIKIKATNKGSTAAMKPAPSLTQLKYFKDTTEVEQDEVPKLAVSPGVKESSVTQHLFYVSKLTPYIIPVTGISPAADCSISIERVPTLEVKNGAASTSVTAAYGGIESAVGPTFGFDFSYLEFKPEESTWYTFTANAGKLELVNDTNLNNAIDDLHIITRGEYVRPGNGTISDNSWANNLAILEPVAPRRNTQTAEVSGYFERGKTYIFTYTPIANSDEERPVDATKVPDYKGTISVKKLTNTMLLGSNTLSVPCYGTGKDGAYFTSIFAFAPGDNSSTTYISIKAGMNSLNQLAKIHKVAVYDNTGTDVTTSITMDPPDLATNGAPSLTMTSNFTGGKTYYVAVQTDSATTCTVDASVKITPSVNGIEITDTAKWNEHKFAVTLKDGTGTRVITPNADGTYTLPYGGKYILTASEGDKSPKSQTFTADKTTTIDINLIKTAGVTVTLHNDTTKGSYCNATTQQSDSEGTTYVTVDVTAKDLEPQPTASVKGCWLDVKVADPTEKNASGATTVDATFKAGWDSYSTSGAVDPATAFADNGIGIVNTSSDPAKFSFEVIPSDGKTRNAWIEVTAKNVASGKIVGRTVYVLRFENNRNSGMITKKPTQLQADDYEYKVTAAAVKGSGGRAYINYSDADKAAQEIRLVNEENSVMGAYAATLVDSQSKRSGYIKKAYEEVNKIYPTVEDNKLPESALKKAAFNFEKVENPEDGKNEFKYLKLDGSGAVVKDYNNGDYFNAVVAIPYLRVDMTEYNVVTAADGSKSSSEYSFETTPYVMVVVTHVEDASTTDQFDSITSIESIVGSSSITTQKDPKNNAVWTGTTLPSGKKIEAIVVDDQRVTALSSFPMTLKIPATAGLTDLSVVQGDKYIYSATEISGESGKYQFTSLHGVTPADFTVTTKVEPVASINGRVNGNTVGEVKYKTLQAAIADAKTGEEIRFLSATNGGDGFEFTATTSSTNLTIVDRLGAPLSKAKLTINGVLVTNGVYAGGTGGGTTPTTPPTAQRNIYVSYSANGSVSATPNPAKVGARVTLTVQPSTGYRLNTITATATKNNTNSNVTLSSSGSNTYTFIMPDADTVSISASFISNGSVTLVSRTGGTLRSSSYNPTPNSVVTITGTPSSGYALTGLSVVNSNGQSLSVTASSSNSNVYTFTMPSSGSVTVTPTWTPTQTVSNLVVTSVTGGAVTPSSTKPAAGDTVVLTVKPNSGYELGSLMVRGTGDTPVTTKKLTSDTFRFTMPSGSAVVTPTWRRTGGSMPYTDSIPAWAKEYVEYTYTHNLMQGVSATLFAGSDNVDRASLWTILSRMDGNYPKTSGSPWYNESRAWAMNQINAGQALSDGTNPTAQVSREQVATMLYRYAASLGKNVSKKADLSGYVDGAKVNSWASDGVRWACANGIINGKDGKRLDPQGNATRNEIAKMIASFCTSLGL